MNKKETRKECIRECNRLIAALLVLESQKAITKKTRELLEESVQYLADELIRK